MARQIQLYMWETQRAHLIERHDFYVDQTKLRVIAQFRDIESEATEYADDVFSQASNSQLSEQYDLGDYAEAAQEAGLAHYELLSDLKLQTMLGAIAGIFHQWEKDLRNFIEQELNHHITNATKIAWEETRTVDELFDLLNDFGWDCRSEPFYKRIDACRLIVNVYKHGKGSSFRILLSRYPEYIQSFKISDDEKVFLEHLGHEALCISDDTFDELALALRQFWQSMPENLYYQKNNR